MINIVIAFDNQNAELGSYFDDCKKDIVDFFNGQDGLVQLCCELPSPQCNAAYIDIRIPQLNSTPFIFIAYTHGIEDGLRCSGDSFVSTVNSHHFTNSLFYSTACLAGKKLAPDLINKGCKAFIGYKEEIFAYKQNEKKEISKNCDNAGIMAFFSDDITIYEACERMKSYYTQQIDKLEDVKDMLFAGDLIHARESIVCLGDKNLKKGDLFVSQ